MLPFRFNHKNWMNWVAFLLPIVTGYITSLSTGMDNSAGQVVASRPPSWVFATVWPILYILIGLSWALMRKDAKVLTLIDLLFLVNVLLLITWIVVYSAANDKKNAVYVLLVTVMVALATFVYSMRENVYSGFMLAPYIGWVIFALMLNFAEVNELDL